MRNIVIELTAEEKGSLLRCLRQAKDWSMARNVLLILACAEGHPTQQVASFFQLSAVTVWRLKKRFLAFGIEGLRDRRRYRAPPKATQEAAELLAALVRGTPRDFGLSRPSWTRQLLAEQLYRMGGLRLSPSTVGRLLARIGARWNRPCPVVTCPWPEDKRKERLAEIQRMLAELPADEIALFEDEIDIHLNPKIGFDWMMRGEQKQVVTPGQNAKRYIAGTVEPLSGELLWVSGEHKDSNLFISLLQRIAHRYRHFRRIHLILDNYSVHKSKATIRALKELGGKVQLHFLPPYCPRENKMELVWLHLHRNVTCNHQCENIDQLIELAERYLALKSAFAFSAHRAAA